LYQGTTFGRAVTKGRRVGLEPLPPLPGKENPGAKAGSLLGLKRLVP
jgi:hypothetical protein